MELLPADTLNLVASYLTSQDAFNLSHANSCWFQYVGDGFDWQRRLQSRGFWQKKFMVTPSLLFRGRQGHNNLNLDSFAYLVDLKTPDVFRLTSFHRSFSFDVWFSLLPASDTHCFGGILYGLQSNQRESRPWPHFHQPIAVVNASGGLYCSVLDIKPVIATDLQPNRWYHLALNYDYDLQRQDVYLNGENVRFDTGPLHEEWSFMNHEQVGTGCVTGGDAHFPYRGHLGWYGFNGLIDEFRVWKRTLSASDVAGLEKGCRLPSSELRGALKVENARMSWMSPDERWVNVQKVSCTRPTEHAKVAYVRSL